MEMKLDLITMDNCPKCEYVKKLFANKKIDLGQEFTLTIKNFKDVDPEFFKKYKLDHVPLIVVHQEGTEGIMIMTQGMTAENIGKTVRGFYGTSPKHL